MRVLDADELIYVNGGDGGSGIPTQCAALESDRAEIIYGGYTGDQLNQKLAALTQRAAGCANHGNLPGYTVSPVYGTIGGVTGNGLQVTDPYGNFIRFVANPAGEKAVFIGGSISF